MFFWLRLAVFPQLHRGAVQGTVIDKLGAADRLHDRTVSVDPPRQFPLTDPFDKPRGFLMIRCLDEIDFLFNF